MSAEGTEKPVLKGSRGPVAWMKWQSVQEPMFVSPFIYCPWWNSWIWTPHGPIKLTHKVKGPNFHFSSLIFVPFSNLIACLLRCVQGASTHFSTVTASNLRVQSLHSPSNSRLSLRQTCRPLSLSFTVTHCRLQSRESPPPLVSVEPVISRVCSEHASFHGELLEHDR